MRLTFYGRPSTRYASSTDASDVVAICHPAVGQAFPQHRAGRKHLRPIVLVDWQLEQKHARPELLGIRVTRSNHRNLTVSHRDIAAILEDVVGPKA
jgi:hypothetical protein